MHRILMLPAVLALTIILASCSAGVGAPKNQVVLPSNMSRVEPNAGNQQIYNELKKNYDRFYSTLSELERKDFQFIDFENGYAYDTKYGFVKLDIGKVDSNNTTMSFMNGSTLPLTPTHRAEISAHSFTAQALTRCAPYYQVKSVTGYSGISAINIPGTPSGMSSGESVNNYIAAYVGSGTAFEGGLVSSNQTGAYDNGYWYVFVRGSGVNNGYDILRDFNPRGGLYGRLTPNNIYGLKIEVQYNNYLKFTVTDTSANYSKVYGFSAPSTNTQGFNQTFGRTTSLLSNSGTDSSGTNYWSSTQLKSAFSGVDGNFWGSLDANRTAVGFPKFAYTNTTESPSCPRAATINRSNYVSNYTDTITITQNSN